MPETIIKAGQEQFKYYPYSGIFHLTRNSFYSAGQDSFTQPPSQNPDLFEVLNNVDPVVQGTLQRRRGYTLFAGSLTSTAFYQRSYAFRSESLGLRRYIWSSNTSVDATDESGNVVLSPVFTPSVGAPFVPRMVLSRDYGYFTDGLQTDARKWDGTTNTLNLTNWGFSGASTAVSTFGPTAPGTASSVVRGGGSVAWNNPNNIKVADGVFATCTLGGGGFSQLLLGSNYGFALTGGIVGIKVDIKFTGTNTGNIIGGTVSLTKDGSNVAGSSKSFLPVPSSNSLVSFGGPTDLWGTTWLPGDINAANFGAFIYFSQNFGTAVTMQVDYMQITIFGQPGALTVGAPGGGLINLLSGRTYFQAFQNSTSGHVGPLSAPSSTTGPLTNNSVPLTNIKVSTDPQVTTVLILATADGNDQTTLYLVASLPNGTTSYTDNTTDLILLTQPIYLNTDISGVIHGIANNNPPPVGLNFPTKHKGRIYGAVGRILYFSKNLSEVTTANGLITSKWEESWPATNQFDISETAETIQGLLSDGETLWIGTERGIRRLVGDSPSNFQEPEIQFNEAGLLTQDVWKVVFYEGQPVGTIWVTPDLRVMASDFNTYQDIGKPIQDVLNTITQDGVGQFNCHASFVSQGPFDLYMLYLSINGSDFPNVVCVFNLRTKTWVVWNPSDSISTSLFNISAQGVPQWLFAATTVPGGPLYFWDQTTRQDRTGNTPISYPVKIRSSWLDVGDSGLVKCLNQQIIYTADSSLTLTVEGAVTQNNLLAAPALVLSPTTVVIGPLGSYLYIPLAQTSSKHYWYRFTWASPASTTQVVLGAFNTEVIPLLRV